VQRLAVFLQALAMMGKRFPKSGEPPISEETKRKECRQVLRLLRVLRVSVVKKQNARLSAGAVVIRKLASAL
jgi:hypothetical protein